MSFFRKSQVVEAPATTPTTSEDILAGATKDFRIAEVEYSDACRELAKYNARTLDNGWKEIQGQRFYQVNTSPERALLSSRVEHSRHARNKTMAKLAALKEEYATHETKCVAGVPVR